MARRAKGVEGGRRRRVEALSHAAAKRRNIPTAETQSFMADEERAPRPNLYPRNPDLDPQLVWRGKDEQDSAPLSVDTVPIYIQEKIHPKAIVEDLKRLKAKGGEKQADLFADFNGIAVEDRLDFYAHQQNWSNRMILGDALLVMNSLAEKEKLRGRVQMIYMDPPYGIRFGSNWQVSTRARDVKDGRAEDTSREPEVIKAFRDTWELGIHSYLSYLRDRFAVARELLTDSGSIFVQIGDENVHLVRGLLDEVFGADHEVVTILVKKKGSQKSSLIDPVNDYVLWYSKLSRRESGARGIKYHQLYQRRILDAGTLEEFSDIELNDGRSISIADFVTSDDEDGTGVDYSLNPKKLFDHYPGSRLYRWNPLTSGGYRKNQSLSYTFQGRSFDPGAGNCWKHTAVSEEAGVLCGMDRLGAANRLLVGRGQLRFRSYFDDYPFLPVSNWWDALGGAAKPIYVVQTNPEIVKRCMLMTTDPGDLVLDPTCGSGTTAYVAEQWGRRWITIDTSRVALALARTRLMAARYPWYILADTPEGLRKEAEVTGRPQPERTTAGDIRRGFVYRRAAHITSGSIANNAEIDAIHGKWQRTLEPLRAEINAALGTRWEEWEVPREVPQSLTAQASSVSPPPSPTLPRKGGGGRKAALPAPAREAGEDGRDRPPSRPSPAPAGEGAEGGAADLLAAWWEARRQRQKEIDESIARNAETEFLYDRPYEDKSIVRVTGPFTVESLSPHRVLPTDEEDEAILEALDEAARERGEEPPPRPRRRRAEQGEEDFLRVVLENLKAAGVQNTKKNERLTFSELKPWAGGRYIHAEGRYEENGKERRAAICIGPEYGTVSYQLVRDAAREAKDLFDVLVVCGFAFEPHVTEETMSLGRLVVLKARMNQDLHMAEHLKKTGAGNLFVVFGEPDLHLETLADGTHTVEIRGVDVFDPTTGAVRSGGTEDIACWFIDTDYDQESFFVRHAYFLGGRDPYERLKRTLKAEIDEEAWATLNRAKSRPFPTPGSGRIAVKVINHYGDEVLKVFEVGRSPLP